MSRWFCRAKTVFFCPPRPPSEWYAFIAVLQLLVLTSGWRLLAEPCTHSSAQTIMRRAFHEPAMSTLMTQVRFISICYGIKVWDKTLFCSTSGISKYYYSFLLNLATCLLWSGVTAVSLTGISFFSNLLLTISCGVRTRRLLSPSSSLPYSGRVVGVVLAIAVFCEVLHPTQSRCCPYSHPCSHPAS